MVNLEKITENLEKYVHKHEGKIATIGIAVSFGIWCWLGSTLIKEINERSMNERIKESLKYKSENHSIITRYFPYDNELNQQFAESLKRRTLTRYFPSDSVYFLYKVTGY